MRWRQLFEDLAAQFQEAAAEAERAEVASRARYEAGAVALADRLRGAMGAGVTVRCRGAGRVSGVLADVGVDWVLLEEDRGADVLISLPALLAVGGLGRLTGAAEDAGPVRGQFDLRRALRALARDRSAVQVVLLDGAVLTGTVDRVGADFLEIATHHAEEWRRPSAVRGIEAVPLSAVAVVRTLVAAGLG
jgi:hypothetical protein